MNAKREIILLLLFVLLISWLSVIYHVEADNIRQYGSIKMLSYVKKAELIIQGDKVIIKDYSPIDGSEQNITVNESYKDAVKAAWNNRANSILAFKGDKDNPIGKIGSADIYYTSIERNKPTHVRLNLNADILNKYGQEDIQCIDASGEYLYLYKHEKYGLLNNPYYHQVKTSVDNCDYSTRNDLLTRYFVLRDESRRSIMGIKDIDYYNVQLAKDTAKIQSYMTRYAKTDPIGKNFEERKPAMSGGTVDCDKGWASYSIPRYIEIKDNNGKTISEFLFLSFFRQAEVGYYKTYLVEDYPTDFIIGSLEDEITDREKTYDLAAGQEPGTILHPVPLKMLGGDDYNYDEVDKIEWVEFKTAISRQKISCLQQRISSN